MVGDGRAPDPGRSTPRQEAHPPGTLMPPPERAKPARKSARCGVGDGLPCPHPPHPQPQGSGPRPHAVKDEWSGVGERPTPDAPHPGKRRPPSGTFMPPPQGAKQACKSARGGVGDGSPRPHPPHPQPVGSGPRPHARKYEWLGVGERPTRSAPQPGKKRPPRAPWCRPYSAPSQRARPARKSARGGVGDGSPRPHPPHGERAAPSQVGGNGTGPPPPKASQTEYGTEAGHAVGHGPSGTALPAPSTGTARGARATPTRGGGGADAARARAHTHTKDTRGKSEGQPEWRTSQRG